MAEAPKLAPAGAIFTPISGFNDVLLRDSQRQEMPPKDMPYTADPDEGLASRRSKHVARSPEAASMAKTSDPALGEGLCLRMAMAGQCENDQFPLSTDRYGKQRK